MKSGSRVTARLGHGLLLRRVDDADPVEEPIAHVEAGAVGRQREAERRTAGLDLAGDAARLQIDDGDRSVIPVCHIERRLVGREREFRRRRANGDRLHHLPGGRIHNRDNTSRMVADEEPGAVRRHDDGVRRLVDRPLLAAPDPSRAAQDGCQEGRATALDAPCMPGGCPNSHQSMLWKARCFKAFGVRGFATMGIL